MEKLARCMSKVVEFVESSVNEDSLEMEVPGFRLRQELSR